MKKRKDGFFKKNFKEGLQYIKESKNFIYFVSTIFILSIIIGYFAPTPEFIEKIILQFIEDLIKKTEGMGGGELISYIFFNNLKSSFFGMAFGIVLGIFSVLTSVLNGYLLGFVASKTVSVAGISVLWKLIPHGIFELPAILISLGFGLKLGLPFIYRYFKHYFNKENFLALALGVLFLFPAIILTLIFDKKLRKKQLYDIVFKINNSIKAFVFVVIPLLVIAAIIEGTLIILFN